MATTADLLADAFGRIREAVHEAVDGLTPGQLAFRPDNGSNSIGWLVWHLTRIQDDHIADVAGTGQIWTSASAAPAGSPGPTGSGCRSRRRPPGTDTAARRSPRSRSSPRSC